MGNSDRQIIIKETISRANNYLKQQGRVIKVIQVSTGISNEVQKLYKNTLDTTVEYKKSDFYKEDEVLMIARISSLNDRRRRQGLPLLEVN